MKSLQTAASLAGGIVLHSPIDFHRNGKPDVNIDVPGVVSQFLSELSTFDIVVELVQNDLDAGSTRTEIRFEQSALVCTGNGRAVDAAGWKRLAYVLGAGTEVIPKQDGIGSKNHGLRSAFLIGDQIVVQSAGWRIDLTVRGHETKRRAFFPAVWPKIKDFDAPIKGIRITVPYRREQLDVPERNPLEPIHDAHVTELFEDAVERAANRFICASRPGRPWKYELVLARGQREFTFTFEAKSVPGGSGLLMRTCRRSESNRSARPMLRRLATAFDIQLAADDHARVPKLFRRGDRILGELSWAVDRDLAPVASSGGYRYPIAYPIEHLSNGWGFDISGPFISGRARHSMSDDARNGILVTQGRTAFVELMAGIMVPLHGPRAFVLATNTGRSDPTAEDELAQAMARAGALPLFSLQSGRATKYQISATDRPLLLCAPTYAPKSLDATLCRIAARRSQALDPSLPQAFVEVLARLAAAGRSITTTFTERDAAHLVLVQDGTETEFESWLSDCVAVLRTLEIARLHGALPAEFLRTLKSEGNLPTTEKSMAKWISVRRSPKPPPPVPGVKPPRLLHHALLKNTILREGTGKVPAFKLDDYVTGLDFSKVIPEGRRRFFNWLRTGYAQLAAKTLSGIAQYPIWPADDGTFWPLNHYCRPRARYLATAIAEVRPMASSAVVEFPGLRAASNASLRLRRTASEDELADWHSARMVLADDAFKEGRIEDLGRLLEDTEETLDRLRSDGYPVRQIAAGHKTLSMAGELVSVPELHIATSHNRICKLLPSDVATGSHFGLYDQLGASTRPEPDALLRAFRSDPDPTVMYARLHAYRAAGRDLAELADERIVFVGAGPLPPGSLCLPSTTDLWGRWKVRLERTPEVPEHVSLLEQAGVIRSSLRGDLSREFFDWLAAQPSDVQRDHLPQIVRHWIDRRHGPAHWIAQYREKRCIPVHDRRGAFELVSLNRSASGRSFIFLPDFEQVQRRLLEDNARMRLTIVTAPNVDGSILEALKTAGVRSLRTFAERPVRLSSGAALFPDVDLDRELVLVQSPGVLRSLPTRLPFHDIPETALRHGWRRQASELRGVGVSTALTAVYRIAGREYEVNVKSGVDEPTRYVCVDANSDRKMGFYSALAGYLFEIGSSSLFEYGLMKAVHDGPQDKLFEDLDGPWREQTGRQAPEDEPRKSASLPQNPPEKGHGTSESQKPPTAPDPDDLKPITRPTYLDRRRPSSKHRIPSVTDGKRHSIEEEAHILSLKSKHYAWHCQACLGEYEVMKATPPHTYVYLPEHRKGLLEAHHVHHLQNEGGLGASNLLILCKYHHQLLGDLLTRDIVMSALARASLASRRFPTDADGVIRKQETGLLATLQLETLLGDTKLFFTKKHAASWK